VNGGNSAQHGCSVGIQSLHIIRGLGAARASHTTTDPLRVRIDAPPLGIFDTAIA